MIKKILLLVLVLAIAFIVVGKITSSYIFKKEENLITNVKNIATNFVENEKEANQLFVGKSVEIKGIIKKISLLNNETTLFLQTPYSDVFIICELNPNQTIQTKQFKKNQTIKVKGTCKGFLKDVILLNCKIITNE